MKRKSKPRRLTNDQINERTLRAFDHIEAMLAAGRVTREQYNSFMLDLGKWAAGKRAAT
jgi:hypothetical protein